MKAVVRRLDAGAFEPQTRKRVGLLLSEGTRAAREQASAVTALVSDAGFHAVIVDLARARDPLTRLKQAKLDAAWCVGAMPCDARSGVYGLLEALEIPYVGSSLLTIRDAADSNTAREMYRFHNLATLPSYEVKAGDQERLSALAGSLGFPLSIVGRTPTSGALAETATNSTASAEVQHPFEVRCPSALSLGAAQIWEHMPSLVVVKQIPGLRYFAALLDASVLAVLPEVPAEGEFVPKDSTRMRGLCNLAARASRIHGCRGANLVELLVTREQNEFVISVDATPSVAPGSLYAAAVASAGLGLTDVVSRLLAGAQLDLASQTTAHESRSEESGGHAVIPAAGIRAA